MPVAHARRGRRGKQRRRHRGSRRRARVRQGVGRSEVGGATESRAENAYGGFGGKAGRDKWSRPEDGGGNVQTRKRHS